MNPTKSIGVPQKEGLPTATHLMSSPYDIHARYAKKNATILVRYKVHLTETCVDDPPNLITNVATTAPVHETDVIKPIHVAFKTKDLLPLTYIADTNYIDAEMLNTFQQDYVVNLLEPTRQDNKWQAQAEQGFAAECFQVNWQKQQVTYPEGKTSSSWSIVKKVYGQETVKIKFPKETALPALVWPSALQLPGELSPCAKKSITWH